MQECECRKYGIFHGQAKDNKEVLNYLTLNSVNTAA